MASTTSTSDDGGGGGGGGTKTLDADDPLDSPTPSDSVQPSMTIHPVNYSGVPMHMYPFPPGVIQSAPLRSKRRQVKNACTNCQKACKKCDDARPCLRCVKYGIAEECVDSQRKERKKGIKRGPYKKRDGKGNAVDSDDQQQHTQQGLPISNGPPPPGSPTMAYPMAPVGYPPPNYYQFATPHIHKPGDPPPPPPPPHQHPPPTAYYQPFLVPAVHAPPQQQQQQQPHSQVDTDPQATAAAYMHHPGFYPAFVPFAPQPYHPQYIMPGRPDAQIAMPSTYAYAPPPPHMYAKPMPPGPSGEIQQPQPQQPIPNRSPQQRHAAEEQPKE